MNQLSRAFWSVPATDLLQQLQTIAEGLTSAQARERLTRDGANRLRSKKRTDPIALFLAQFKSPIVLILLFAVALSFFLQARADALIILTIDQARARLEQAKQTLALAETQLGYATRVSPLAGVVLSKNVEPGEYVAAGTPVVAVGDLEYVWLRAYINETDLGRVKIGQRLDVTTDTYPGKV